MGKELGAVRVCLGQRHPQVHPMGHVAAIPEIEQLIDADHIVRGDGISWIIMIPQER